MPTPPRVFGFAGIHFRAFVPAILGAYAFSWIAGCSSSDPDAASTTPMTWAVRAADAAVPLDAGTTSDDETLAFDGGIDASQEPVQSFRDPDAGPVVCSAPNKMCEDYDAGTSACVAVGTDPGNCGACGNACVGSGAVCIGGQCACSGTMQGYCPGGASADSDGGGDDDDDDDDDDDASAAPGCIDLSSDTNNCGACGNVCDDGQDCNAGACVDDCDDCKVNPTHKGHD